MKKWIVAFAGVAAIAIIGAGAVVAQTPGTSTGTSFWDRVAQKLGIDAPKLKDAVKSARTDQIDEAVQNGDLTQKQADALKQRLDQMPDDGPRTVRRPEGHGGFPARLAVRASGSAWATPPTNWPASWASPRTSSRPSFAPTTQRSRASLRRTARAAMSSRRSSATAQKQSWTRP